MSDDLQAQIKEMRDLAALTRGFFGVHPQSGADHLEEIADRIQAHLDRDRKMKAELAEDINKALGIWSKTLPGVRPDRARLIGIDIRALQTLVAKLEADSKTEAKK